MDMMAVHKYGEDVSWDIQIIPVIRLNIELLPLTLLPAAGNRNEIATFSF